MDPIGEAPARAEGGDDRAVLVLQIGRQDALRRPLDGPLTLLGRSAACDVEINLDGVEPVHCAIVAGPDGYVLRDCGGALGTLVNGGRVRCCPLGPGDQIGIGPYLFVLELPRGIGDGGGEEAEREALRVPAAAGAAQQSAFDDEEQRLHAQRVALERQQKQLAAHLEERRRKLHEMREELKAEREQLQADRATVEREKAEADSLKAQTDQDRQRLAEMRQKLERRQERQFAEREAALGQREQELAAARNGLDQKADELKRDRATLEAVRLRFNGDAELSRRELGEGWEQLALAQQQWEATLDQEHRERARRDKALEERARALARAEQALAEERRHWERRRLDLEREAAGLDARVRNLRDRLPPSPSERTPLTAGAPAATPVPAPPEPAAPQRLQRLADTLADQRAHLVQQWQAMLAVHEQWHRDRQALLAEVEAAARRLGAREQHLLERERTWQPREEALVRREEALTHLRLSLEGWQLRLTAEAVAWEADRYALLTELQGREAVVTRQMHLLETLRRRLVGGRSVACAS